MEPTSQEKTRYRQTKAWKELRQAKIDEVKSGGKLRCQMSGVILKEKTAQVHHLDPSDYYGTDLSKYVVLSPSMHDWIELVARIKKDTWPDWDKWEVLLRPFLPKTERTVDKYYRMMEEQKDFP